MAEPYFTASPTAHPDPGTQQQLIRPATSPEPAKPKLVLIAPARRRGLRRRAMADGASSSGGAQNGGESVVIDYGRRRTTCGYCRSSGSTSISHGTDSEPRPMKLIRSASTCIGPSSFVARGIAVGSTIALNRLLVLVSRRVTQRMSDPGSP